MNLGLLVLGRSEASMLMRSDRRKDIVACIAIQGSREFVCDGFDDAPTRLELVFDDCRSPELLDPINAAAQRMLYQEWAHNGRVMMPPTRRHVEQIIAFARAIMGQCGTLLVHCQAGISRSPAAALACLAVWLGEGNERRAWEMLWDIRPSAQPHSDSVRWTDELLARNGRLINAR